MEASANLPNRAKISIAKWKSGKFTYLLQKVVSFVIIQPFLVQTLVMRYSQYLDMETFHILPCRAKISVFICKSENSFIWYIYINQAVNKYQIKQKYATYWQFPLCVQTQSAVHVKPEVLLLQQILQPVVQPHLTSFLSAVEASGCNDQGGVQLFSHFVLPHSDGDETTSAGIWAWLQM